VILVAEDEPMVRAHILRTLERCGYSVLEAENGQRAVDVFRANSDRVDLLLLDAIMPVLDGWNAFLQISALRPGIKVLFATGYAADVLPPDFAASGARLLNKPFETATLFTEVQALLQKAEPSA
jgi:CheY-like chemotaxis protein